jgi:hypothetical protein
MELTSVLVLHLCGPDLQTRGEPLMASIVAGTSVAAGFRRGRGHQRNDRNARRIANFEVLVVLAFVLAVCVLHLAV